MVSSSLMMLCILTAILTVKALVSPAWCRDATAPRQAPLPVICIDPGHPSETNPGAAVQNGLREVEVVYDVALELKSILEDEGVAQIVLTRRFRGYDAHHPVIVTNRKRAEIANDAHAFLFLRLHCDTGKGSGFTLYYPNRQGKKFGVTGPSAAVREASEKAAVAVHKGMQGVLVPATLHDNGVKGESATFVGGKQGVLTGSIFSKVPTVTVEMAVLSNRHDAVWISSKEGRHQMAQALARGVTQYLGK